MNARPAKFTFSNEFSSGEPRRPQPSAQREAAEKAAELAAAEARGHALGFGAGEQSAKARELGRLSAAIEQFVSSSMHILGTLDQLAMTLEQEAIALAIATAQRLAKGLIDSAPVVEIERVAREALSHVRRAPHLVLRVHLDLVESVEARMKAIAWERGYEGRVVVLGEPDIMTGDCRIEWADGGLVRDSTAMMAAIDEAITRYLTARASGDQE